jgi:hypothetical protein
MRRYRQSIGLVVLVVGIGGIGCSSSGEPAAVAVEPAREAPLCRGCGGCGAAQQYCLTWNSSHTATCDPGCWVDPTCVIHFNYPDSATPCTGFPDCHRYACDGAGNCAQTSMWQPNGTACTNFNSACAEYVCSSGSCTKALCSITFGCDNPGLCADPNPECSLPLCGG